MRFSLAFWLAGVACGVASAQVHLDQAALLRRMTDLDRLSTPPPAGEHSLVFSSYDRASHEIVDGRYAHWDANNDRNQFLRRTDDGWDVLMEWEHPGVIHRFWVDQPAGTLRIEIDGADVVRAPFDQLFDGSIEPLGEPLTYRLTPESAGVSHMPMGFAKRVRVMTQGFQAAYQIDATTWVDGTTVASYRPEFDEAAAAALADASGVFSVGLEQSRLLSAYRTTTLAAQQDLKPREALTETLEAPGTIRALYVSLTDQRPPPDRYYLHQVLLRVYFDDSKEPDVEAPLTAFFGSGFHRNRYNSLVMGNDYKSDMPAVHDENEMMYCYFPMPYQRNARIEIRNENPQRGVGVLLYARIDRDPPRPDALRFRARFRVENPCESFDYSLLTSTGAGRIVGAVLSIDTPSQEYWGTGDAKLWIDDESFPALWGADTSGFFANDAPPRYRIEPLSGATLVQPYGKNSLYRWMLAEAPTFHNYVRLAIENWQPPNSAGIYYSSMVYWYGQPDARTDLKPIARDALAVHGLRVPNAVEVEGHVQGLGWGSKLSAASARTELSGDAGANITTTEPVKIRVPVAEAGRYRVSMRVHPRRPFKSFRVHDAAGGLIGEALYARNVRGVYVLGETELKQGDNLLTFQTESAVVVDCWILERAQEAP